MKIKLIDFGAKLRPMRAHDNDAGADVYAPRDYEVPPHGVTKVPLGFGVKIPDGMSGYIFPRSSMAAKGITCELPPIDSGYRGEIHAILTNPTDQYYTIHEGDRIGQLVIMPVIYADFTFETSAERGTGAFGSTGK